MPYDAVNHEPAYRIGYLAAIGLAIVLIAIFQPFAKPEPTNSRAYGCYTAHTAPAIRPDQSGMKILQAGFPLIPFHLERHKTAITLTADAPIKADPLGEKYIYSMYHPGIGTYLDFKHVVNGRIYGQFDETSLEMFVMLAWDGMDLVYTKTSSEYCRNG